MSFLKAMRKVSIVAASLVATFALALCVNKPLQLCLCDDDPDDCGEHCHECAPETDHDCNHIVIELETPSPTQTSVSVPVVAAESFISSSAVQLSHRFILDSLLPSANKPPDLRGTYISSSTRLYPLS